MAVTRETDGRMRVMVAKAKKMIVLHALKLNEGHQGRAAKWLGIGRSSLTRQLLALGVTSEELRELRPRKNVGGRPRRECGL